MTPLWILIIALYLNLLAWRWLYKLELNLFSVRILLLVGLRHFFAGFLQHFNIRLRLCLFNLLVWNWAHLTREEFWVLLSILPEFLWFRLSQRVFGRQRCGFLLSHHVNDAFNFTNRSYRLSATNVKLKVIPTRNICLFVDDLCEETFQSRIRSLILALHASLLLLRLQANVNAKVLSYAQSVHIYQSGVHFVRTLQHSLHVVHVIILPVA